MMYLILLAIAFVALAVGSYTDIKTREVPDWVNYSLIFLGIGLRLLYSAMTGEWMFLLEGAIGLGAFFSLAMFMFYAGQWGGGDSKMLMGIGALVGLGLDFDHMPVLLIFLVNLLLVGAFYGLLWSIILAVANRKKFGKAFSEINEKARAIRRAVMVATIIILIPAIIARGIPLKVSFLLLALITMASYYMWILARAVEKSCMYRLVNPKELTEGDWIAKEIKVKGKLICGPKDLGIEKKQIRKLIRLKVDKVLVKDGIPFVPSFLIAFIITLLLGNWIRFLF